MLISVLGLMLAVQGLPTSGWSDSEIAELLAKAFMLRSTYTVKDVEAGHWNKTTSTISVHYYFTHVKELTNMYRSDVQFKPNLVSFFCYDSAKRVFLSWYPRLYNIDYITSNNTITYGCSLNINSSRA